MKQYGYRLEIGGPVYGGFATVDAAVRAAAAVWRGRGKSIDRRVVTVGEAAADAEVFTGKPQFAVLRAPLDGGVDWVFLQ